MSIIYQVRKVLVNLGKILPFVLTFILCISYSESLFSVITQRYVEYGEHTILETNLSYWLAQIFEYDWLSLFVLFTLSISLETCIYNKMACGMLAINLLEKTYLSQIELYPTTICIICLCNILVCGWLTFKGITIYLRNR